MLPEPAANDLTSLYEAHYDELVRLAAVLVDDRGLAEELVQDAFVGLVRKSGGLRDPDRSAAYLRSSVLNGARSRLRRRRTQRRHLEAVRAVDHASSAEHDVVRASEHRQVIDALRRLPLRQREVLTLRYQLDLSEAEIAQSLGISAGSVKTHASRGLHRLRDLLEENDR